MPLKDKSMAVCPVCFSEKLIFLSDYRGEHTIFQDMKLLKCCMCDLVFANPMPKTKDLEAYNSKYFDNAHGGHDVGTIALAFFSGIADLRISYIERYLTKYNAKISRVLEIGPGPGYFFFNWVRGHPSTEYFALETDLRCHEILLKNGVRLIDVNNGDGDKGKFDLVVMSHVLEHSTNPIEMISSSTKNLRQGGIVFIEVPCSDWMHKDVDEPHLLFFDKKSMLKLLTNQGFDSIEVSYYGNKITDLKAKSLAIRLMLYLRTKLIGLRFILPFCSNVAGMENLTPIQKAVLKPFLAHKESDTPAWWLRAVAIKS